MIHLDDSWFESLTDASVQGNPSVEKRITARERFMQLLGWLIKRLLPRALEYAAFLAELTRDKRRITSCHRHPSIIHPILHKLRIRHITVYASIIQQSRSKKLIAGESCIQDSASDYENPRTQIRLSSWGFTTSLFTQNNFIYSEEVGFEQGIVTS